MISVYSVTMDLHILLVEDEEQISMLYKTVLQKAGYNVEAVGDGALAIEKLSNPDNKFDLILLDLMIPKTDGMSVLKMIKKDDRLSRIPVFVMSNLGQDEIVKEALQIGASRYLIKAKLMPMDLIELIKQTFTNSMES